MSLNLVLLSGNVGKDPDIRHLESGATLAQFTLATSERFKDRSGEFQEQTEWHNIVCWNGLADIVGNFVKKGSRLFVEGKMRTRSWDDDKGFKHFVTEIIATNLQLLDRKENSQQQRPLPPEPAEPAAPRQSVTEAAARVAAAQRKGYRSNNARQQPRPQDDAPATTPLVNPLDIQGEDPDDLPF